MEVVYVVVKTYGDYIGWFESEVLGVFVYKSDAEYCLKAAEESPKQYPTTQITIEESTLMG